MDRRATYADNLADGLYKRMLNKELCDLTINVCNSKFFCHKIVVASASSVLEKVIRQSLATQKVDNGNLDIWLDSACPGVMGHILKYFYTGEDPPLDSELFKEFCRMKQWLCRSPTKLKIIVESENGEGSPDLQKQVEEDDCTEREIKTESATCRKPFQSTCKTELNNSIVRMGSKASRNTRHFQRKPPKLSSRNKYHLPRKPPFACPSESCGKIFETHERLRGHFRHNHSEKKFKCDLCPQRFLYPKDLKTHMRTHTGEKPFICEMCGRGFAQRGSMYVHTRRHLKNKSELGNTYPCPQCIKLYTQRESTKTLLSRISQTRGSGALICPNQNCARKFASIQTLRKHIHRDVCNFTGCMCSDCKVKFDSNQQLKKHIGLYHCTHRKVSNDEMPPSVLANEGQDSLLQCHFCTLSFNEQSDLSDHIRNHENVIDCETLDMNVIDRSACGEVYSSSTSLVELCSEVVMGEDISSVAEI